MPTIKKPVARKGKKENNYGPNSKTNLSDFFQKPGLAPYQSVLTKSSATHFSGYLRERQANIISKGWMN